MKSDSGSANRWCCSWAACSCPVGRSRGSWIDSAAASTSTSPTTPCRSASSTMRARRGSAGIRASRRPILVRRTWSRDAAAVEGSQLLEEQDPVLDAAARRAARRTGRRRCRPRPRAAIWRMTEARLVRRISGSVNSGRAVEVLLGVQADARARRDPPAAAGPLGRRRLRDRLDRQALHLGAAVVAGDAGRARVDHADDPGDGERRLGDVGGQHDPPPAVRREHPVLLGRRQPRVERQELGAAQVEPAERLRGVADLALAREEHEDVARARPA